jgi:general secretion pathway protein I
VRARGFTLVEVMVALAIVSIALPALLMALSRQADDTAYLRDKTIAQMVAANKLAETRLVIGSTRNLAAGKDNGIATMVDRDWYWWMETKPTPMEKFFRVEISVALEDEQKDQPLYKLTGFMSSDLEIDTEGFSENSDDSDDSGNQDTSKSKVGL